MAADWRNTLEALVKLRDFVKSGPPELEEVVYNTFLGNKWFTIENIHSSLNAIIDKYLDPSALETWIAGYSSDENKISRKIGLVTAGNIPMVGFHDILCILVSGHQLVLKPSTRDTALLEYLLQLLGRFSPELNARIHIVERLKEYDAVIATGNDNSARYFEYYFRHVPSIIRKNRNSVAVLTGQETATELSLLAHDVFDYFGLGCRNVSKIFVPEGYDFTDLVAAFDEFKPLADHHLYRNNLDYNRTLLLLNNIPFLNVDYVNITQNPMIASPISNLHYESYKNLDSLGTVLSENSNHLQCIVGDVEGICDVKFGNTQQPSLTDYADKIDTMRFLKKLSINN